MLLANHFPQALPQELVDHIIDDVADLEATDSIRGSLSSCRLVCHSWDARAARHLLKRVSVTDPKLGAFLRFAKTSERIRTFTQELSILSAVYHFGHWIELFAALPKLSALELRSDLVVPAEPAPSTSDSAVRTHALANLKIHCVKLDNLLLFLRPFCRVETLCLSCSLSINSVAGEQGESTRQITPLPVGRLVLETCCLFDTLRILKDIVRPTALVINGILRRNFGAVNMFLKSTAPDIEELILHPIREETPVALEAMLLPWDQARRAAFTALGECSKMTSLELDIMNVSWCAYLFQGVLLHMPEGIERLRLTLGYNQWTQALDTLSSHFGAAPEKYGSFARLELCGLCEGLLPDDEQKRLRELQAGMQSCLPPRICAVATIFP
ncbi:hypothetical protein PsYK624_115160 [Phanerochaete sordida]|uniref:F-box domain-containing protein n=1 Tax=Phanerochaete sordida TaxID=48140 RepID=A0A9P3GGS5_9APHY|nr:hypothetical protein PsYK624_115160 [Phanerochaete sordida]